MRIPRCAIVALAALALFTTGCSQQRSDRPRPNVVIVLVDDLGFGDPGFRGSEIATPALDRLAAEGLVLERFYSQPECTPSRAALLTGRHPIRFGLVYSVLRPWSSTGLPIAEELMAEPFRKAGYKTALVGKWHLGHAREEQLPNARGFDHFYGHLNGRIDYYRHCLTHAENPEIDLGLDWQRNGTGIREEGYATDLLAKEAVELIETAAKSQQPLFLLLSLNAPHPPLQAPPSEVSNTNAASIDDPVRRTYAAMVESLDKAVGSVLSALDRTGQADETLVLFLSDNGASPSRGGRNLPLRGGKATTLEGGIRVPAMIRYPGVLPKGAKSSQVLSILDVFPTLVAAVQLDPPKKTDLDGASRWRELRTGTTSPPADLFFATQNRSKRRQAVLSFPWKLIREDNVLDQSRTVRLFRVDEDPHEMFDRAGEEQKMTRQLTRILEEWLRLHPAQYQRPPYAPPPGWTAPNDWATVASSGQRNG